MIIICKMISVNAIILTTIIASNTASGSERKSTVINTDLIDQLIDNHNYANDAWNRRGINPPSLLIIQLMDTSTKQFLIDLKRLAILPVKNRSLLNKQVETLVDGLPWTELNTEERDFLADVIAPGIKIFGVDPWVFFSL